MNSWKIPIFIIPGNHESEESLKEVSSKYKNIFYINKKIKVFKDYVLVGIEGNGFAKKDIEFERIAKAMSLKINSLKKKKKFIFVSHAPPFKTELDIIGKTHVGNQSVSLFIKKTKPIIAVSGHIHETSGTTSKLGNTIIVNPGRKGIIFDI